MQTTLHCFFFNEIFSLCFKPFTDKHLVTSFVVFGNSFFRSHCQTNWTRAPLYQLTVWHILPDSKISSTIWTTDHFVLFFINLSIKTQSPILIAKTLTSNTFVNRFKCFAIFNFKDRFWSRNIFIGESIITLSVNDDLCSVANSKIEDHIFRRWFITN